MSEDEDIIKNKAEEYARQNKKQIAAELADIRKYTPEEKPLSVFMAGSPGAGKTEYSENLIKILESGISNKVVRIDGDTLRPRLPGYTGGNSRLFNKAISDLVNATHDLVLIQGQTFLLDGTFSNYKIALENINRSLSRGRFVIIFYVYQTPEVAWSFTQARQLVEGRDIPKDIFIQKFLEAREVIRRIRAEFDDRVSLFLIKKNFKTHNVEEVVEVMQKGASIDDHLGRMYTREELERLL